MGTLDFSKILLSFCASCFDTDLCFVFLFCSGIFIKTLADASYDRQSLSAPQIIFNVVGFLATIATTIIFTIYAKRQLKTLRSEEEPLLE